MKTLLRYGPIPISNSSIRIDKQWRICFEWRDGHAFEVESVNYHQAGKALDVPLPRVNDVEREKRSISQ